jgi:hypothetical protein
VPLLVPVRITVGTSANDVPSLLKQAVHSQTKAGRWNDVLYLLLLWALRLIKHHATKTHWGVEVQLHAFLTSALDGGEWSAWIWDWVGPGATSRITQKLILFPIKKYHVVTQTLPEHILIISGWSTYVLGLRFPRRWRFKSMSSGFWGRVVLW